MTNYDHPDAYPHQQAAGPTRYDHRDDAARAADAEEGRVIDAPLEEGAAELREQTADAERRGEVESDPAAPR